MCRMSAFLYHKPKMNYISTWKFKEFMIFFFKIAVIQDLPSKPRANKKTSEHPTRFLSMKVTKIHFSNAHWSEERASDTAMSKTETEI